MDAGRGAFAAGTYLQPCESRKGFNGPPARLRPDAFWVHLDDKPSHQGVEWGFPGVNRNVWLPIGDFFASKGASDGLALLDTVCGVHAISAFIAADPSSRLDLLHRTDSHPPSRDCQQISLCS